MFCGWSRTAPGCAFLFYFLLSSYYTRSNNNFQQEISRDTWREPFRCTIFVWNAPRVSFGCYFFFFSKTISFDVAARRRQPDYIISNGNGARTRPSRIADKNNTTKRKETIIIKPKPPYLFYSHPIILRSSLTSTHQRPPVHSPPFYIIILIILLLLYTYNLYIYTCEHFGGPSALGVSVSSMYYIIRFSPPRILFFFARRILNYNVLCRSKGFLIWLEKNKTVFANTESKKKSIFQRLSFLSELPHPSNAISIILHSVYSVHA